MRIVARIVDWFAFPYSLILLVQRKDVSWKTKLKAGLIVGAIFFYILDPVDLIPDFTPVLGWIDDVLTVPLAAALTKRAVPEIDVAELRQQASSDVRRIIIWVTALIAAMIIISLSVLGILIYLAVRHWS